MDINIVIGISMQTQETHYFVVLNVFGHWLISGVPVFLPPSSLSTAATACLVILSILIAQPAASILGVYQPDFVFYTKCHASTI